MSRGTIYRGWVKTRAVGTDLMLPPSFRHEVARVSIGATAIAVARLVELMAANIPRNDLRARAEAVLEISRPREGCHVLCRYSGQPTRMRPSNVVNPCGICAGQWSLEAREVGVHAPLTVAVGGPYQGPRSCGGCARMHHHVKPYVCHIAGGCPCDGCIVILKTAAEALSGVAERQYTRWVERLP